MTGYLARLAARAVGEPAATAPRLPSRFAPGTDLTESPPDQATPVDETHPPLREPDVHEGGRATSSATSRGATPTAADHRPVEVPRHRTGSGPVATPAPSRPAEALIADGPVPARAVAATSAAGRAPDLEAALRPGRSATAPAPVPADPVVRGGGPLAPTVGAPPAARRPETSGSPGSSGSSGPPVVRVSIGRVEVRMPAPPAPAPDPSPTAGPVEPVLSLHDYLGGRRGPT